MWQCEEHRPHLADRQGGAEAGPGAAAGTGADATHGTPLSASTLHSIRCTLRAALNAAIREGLLTDNPARWVELPTHRRPHAVVWTHARVAAWQAAGRASEGRGLDR